MKKIKAMAFYSTLAYTGSFCTLATVAMACRTAGNETAVEMIKVICRAMIGA